MKLFPYLIKRFTKNIRGKRIGVIENIDGINMDEVAYAEWSCIYVGDCYDETKSYDYERTYWIPKLVTIPKPPPPPPLCKNHKNWKCIIVYVMIEEVGAKETSEFIQKSGGIVTKAQFDEYIKNKFF